MSAYFTDQFGYAYDDASRRTMQTRIGSAWTNTVDYTYDSIGQLKTASGKEADGTLRQNEQFGYAYDAAWNLNYRTNKALVQTFNCDDLNQLTTITRSGNHTVSGVTWGAATNVTVTDNGNAAVAATRYADNTFARTNVTLLNGTNTFTAVAQDSSGRTDTNTTISYLPATNSYVYDGNGNLTTNGTRVFEYDDENQLTRITEPSAWKSEFTYDGKMRRRIRKEYTWQSGVWNLQSEIHYVYDGKLPIQERWFNPQLSTLTPQQSITYTRGRDLSGSLEGAGGIGGLLARSDSSLLIIGDSSAHAYYHTDGNGNVCFLVNTNQGTAARYTYSPYGNSIVAVGELADVNAYRSSSKEFHQASSLVYYLYRCYDASLDRWFNRDPLVDQGHFLRRSDSALHRMPQAHLEGRFLRRATPEWSPKGLNLYAFVSNQPVGEIDFFGMKGCTYFCARVGTLAPIYLCCLQDDDGCGNCPTCFGVCNEMSELGFTSFSELHNRALEPAGVMFRSLGGVHEKWKEAGYQCVIASIPSVLSTGCARCRMHRESNNEVVNKMTLQSAAAKAKGR